MWGRERRECYHESIRHINHVYDEDITLVEFERICEDCSKKVGTWVRGIFYDEEG